MQAVVQFLPAGAILWAWEADADFDEVAGEQWLVLLPNKWAKQVQYAWRYDPCEPEVSVCAGAARAGARTAPRTPCFEDACTDDEDEDLMGD